MFLHTSAQIGKTVMQCSKGYNINSTVLSQIRASHVAQLVKNPPPMWETWVQSLVWEDSPGEGNGYPLLYSGLLNSMDCMESQRVRHD